MELPDIIYVEISEGVGSRKIVRTFEGRRIPFIASILETNVEDVLNKVAGTISGEEKCEIELGKELTGILEKEALGSGSKRIYLRKNLKGNYYDLYSNEKKEDKTIIIYKKLDYKD